jgi:hypothetical protein
MPFRSANRVNCVNLPKKNRRSGGFSSKENRYSGFAPEALTTFAHFLISDWI